MTCMEFPGAARFPYKHHLKQGGELQEFPPATLKIAGAILPAAGGGYLRNFPLGYTHFAFQQFERTTSFPLVVYLHPWELDPDQPRIAGRWRSRLRHYTNLRRMEERLRSLLERYQFGPLRDWLEKPVSEFDRKVAPLAGAQRH